MQRPSGVPRRGEFAIARLRLRRRAVVWWLAAGALAVSTVVATVAGGSETGAAAWGTTRPVVVAGETIPVGATIRAGSIETTEWPTAMVPSDAVVGPVDGRVAVAEIGAGEVVVERRLAPGGLTGAAALLQPGQRALAVPVGSGALALQPGDRVDVLATVDPFALGLADSTEAGPAASTVVVAPSATVVAVADDATTVAVTASDATDVAAAVGQGVVTLALTSPLDAPAASPASG